MEGKGRKEERGTRNQKNGGEQKHKEDGTIQRTKG